MRKFKRKLRPRFWLYLSLSYFFCQLMWLFTIKTVEIDVWFVVCALCAGFLGMAIKEMVRHWRKK